MLQIPAGQELRYADAVASKERVVLTDPRAIRALAHPARQVIIDELYSGRVLTATECAELAGLTPSATSYHLRALERWGIVERAEASGDGRERPWRALGSGLQIASQSTTAGRLASQAMMRSNVDQVLERFEELPADDDWYSLSVMNRSRLWLTREETAELDRELSAVIDRFRQDRTAAAHPEATRSVYTLIAVVPAAESPTP
ncbi:helix-turn-helix transcriptional regulator [Kribbella sandramycini]|uniref:Helix-turn-helix transcriptional regulator n=1 Tax=Kribbella sandramycini TaxID=60450 RepID=A0A7Y4L394_9ACTN|nr:winged helix-turn-helix domain-containing protein [Kribbella sandramycini]NOL42626.1 helix-turn-helix transcriptional regulator [Kribbella sandramycini]